MSKSVSEIRFAVVMYGGLSLAIYINGVAQELLKMVRATNKGFDLDSTETVYYKIACLLGNTAKLKEISNAQTLEDVEKIIENINPAHCSPSRFVIDILSGTSAGGINAVFLAKALANNQDINQLQQLWQDEGEIAKLINDKKSVKDTQLKSPEKVKSLFNSQRMYLKLLNALEGMEAKSGAANVRQLDLFVTVTDFAGVKIPFRLTDKPVNEKQFKQVLHFRYDDGINDFKRKHNPMLAFAARCTSAFPFAFEPMRFSAAKEVIERSYADANEKIKNLSGDIKRLFPLTKDSDGRKIKWEKRDLVDGGVLDNKPFGHAINAIAGRTAEVNVQRKLIYVEPAPEEINFEQEDREPPDAISNLKACAADMPAYETIREDLERVIDRNRLIERVNRFISNAEKDVFNYRLNIESNLLEDKKNEPASPDENASDETRKLPESGEDWGAQGLEDIVQWKGNAALPYYHLRVATLTDELAQIISRKLGINENSEYFRVIRTFVRLWRRRNYGNYRKENSPTMARDKTVLSFLREFDLNYRLRRLRFVLNKADQLYHFSESFQKELEIRQSQVSKIAEKIPEKYEPQSLQQSNFSVQSYSEGTCKQMDDTAGARRGKEKTPSELIWEKCRKNTPDHDKNREQMRRIVEQIEEELNEVSKILRRERDNLFRQKSEFEGDLREKNESDLEWEAFEKEIAKIRLSADALTSIVTEIGSGDQDGFDEIRDNEITGFLENNYGEVFEIINAASAKLKEILSKSTSYSRNVIAKNLATVELDALEIEGEKIEPDLINAVRLYLNYFYKNFDDLSDQISFPIFYETPVGEAVPIEILRISPRDAKGLIDEENLNIKRKKLAGTQVFNFGAFFDQVWRKNDIMWGRLDGAERLVLTLLPEDKYEKAREYFTKQAHEIILREELLRNNNEALQREFGESLLKSSAGIDIEKAVGIVTGRIGSEAVKKRLTEVLGSCIKEENLYSFVKENYEIDRRLEPKPILQVISRSTKVTGDILDNIADDRKFSSEHLRWVTRLGQIFWGLVEVAAPNSFWNLLFHNWLNLIYFFEVILIVVSTFLVNNEIQKFGVVTLVFTLLTHMTVLTLTDVIKGGKNLKLAQYFGIGIFIVLALTGATALFSFFFSDSLWARFSFWQENWTNIPASQRMLAAFPVTILILYLIWQKSDKPDRLELRKAVIAFLAGFFLTGALIMWFTAPAKTDENSIPMLNIQFVRSPEEVPKYAGEFDSRERRGIKRALAIDSYLLVPVYAGFIFYLAQLFRLRREKWARFFRVSVSIFIIIAALADLTENYFMFSMLELQTAQINQWLINTVSISAVIKWLTVFIAIILLIIGGIVHGWSKNDSQPESYMNF